MITEPISTDTRLFSPAEIAARMCPADQPGVVTEAWVKRRISSRSWPSTKLGPIRGMTEAQFQQALDIEAREAHPSPVRSAAGLSPRTRHRKAAS